MRDLQSPKYTYVVFREGEDVSSIISVRTESVPDTATVVVQMGRGDSRGNSQLLKNVRRGHDHWRGVFDIRGRFAISAYVLDGLDEASLLTTIPNDTFGRSTVGEIIRSHYEMVPTTIRIPAHLPAYSFQPWHYSVILSVPGVDGDVSDEESLWLGVREPVRDELERLLALFEPRISNPYRL